MQNVKMDIKTAKEKSIQGNKNLKYHEKYIIININFTIR